jgi:DNA-directed RNA polymerase specialized sigma subunit
MARDAISLLLEIPEHSFDIEIHFEMTDGMREVLNEMSQAKAAAEQAQSVLAQHTRSAVRYLKEHGFSTRDSGKLIGLSAQRISQLLAENPN